MKKSKGKSQNTSRQMEIKHNFPFIWDAAEAVLRGNCIAIQDYFKKEEKTQMI